MNKFWKFRNQADTGAELLLYGDISQTSWWGDEATPKQFAEDMAALGNVGKITVRINSGGGDVFAAQAIGNLLEQSSAETVAHIDGLCASAATIVACHCDKVEAAADSTYMIHPAKMGICDYVDAVTMRQYLAALDTIRENIVTLYAKKTGRDKDEVAGWMDATSWWTGEQAKANGFVDELVGEEKPTVENRGGVLFVNSTNMNLPFEKAPNFVKDRLAKAAVSEHKTTTEEEKNMEIKTVDDLRKAYPALCEQLTKEAAAQAENAERKRIQDIEDLTVPGSENVAKEAKFVKPVNAEAFAVALVKNARMQGASYLAQARKDAEDSGADGVKQERKDKGGEDEFLNAIRKAGKKEG